MKTYKYRQIDFLSELYFIFKVFSYNCTSKKKGSVANFYLESNFRSNCLLPLIIPRVEQVQPNLYRVYVYFRCRTWKLRIQFKRPKKLNLKLRKSLKSQQQMVVEMKRRIYKKKLKIVQQTKKMRQK